jgi:putative hemolysin
MATVYVEIGIIALLILLNGLFAMSELAIVAARRARLQPLADAGDPAAAAALALANSPGRFLSTVQIGITLVGILAGAFSGAMLAEPLGEVLNRAPAIAPHGEGLGLAIVVAVITYLTLVVGELAPKHLALGDPERIALAIARPMRRLAGAAAPLVWLLDTSTTLLLRLVGARPAAGQAVTEEEVRALIAQGTRAGIFAQAERDMLEGVFRLSDRPVGAIMTPRRDVVWLDIADSPEEIRRKVAQSPYFRFPVASGGLDDVLGFVEVKDLLSAGLDRGAAGLRAVLRPALAVHEATPIPRVLERFKAAPVPMALVVDEYGEVRGVVTAGHILEAIVGDLPRLGREAAPQAIRRADGSWLIDGLLPMDEVRERLALPAVPRVRGARTLAGFVLASLGRIPAAGQSFTFEGFRFEVVDMDGRRVDKVLVTPVDRPDRGGSGSSP